MLSRFAGDTATIDERLNDDACDALRQGCVIGVTMLVIAAADPRLVLGAPPLWLAFSAVRRRYAASARELQRLESVARSPIFGAVSEALAGAATVRALGEGPRFRAELRRLVDSNLAAYFAQQSCNRWLTVRTEGLASAVVAATALAALRGGLGRPGAAGLAIGYALQACSALSWLVRALAAVETEVVSVERVSEFATLAPEPPLMLPHARPPRGWPAAGALELQDVGLRYRPRPAPAVLAGVTARIPGGSKVGVVGRTGAGKSSLLAALLRLGDPELAEGRVLIDGLDTATIGVGDLRRAVAVVPQEGTLFAGTLRFNLDPTGRATDADLLAALSLAGLLGGSGGGRAAAAARRPLDEPVAEEGGNWSAGQRQLLCLARASLRRSRLALADEATSACDAATDAAVQAAMRTAFEGATVLTVAHRLGTVAACDLILVLSAGRLAEMGPPAELAARPGGLYAAMLAQAAGGGGAAPRPP